jgi:hypothetical protein
MKMRMGLRRTRMEAEECGSVAEAIVVEKRK